MYWLRTLALSCTLVLLAAGAASAQFYIGWGDSPTNGAPATHVTECRSNSGANTLVFTWVPASDVRGIVAFLLDLTTGVGDGTPCDPAVCVPPSLPPFWDLRPEGCRAGAISASLDFSAPPYSNSTHVTDAWQGRFPAQTQPWFLQTRLAGPAGHEQPYTVGRFQVVGFAASGDSVNLLAGHEYYIATITLQNTLSNAGGCDGCCMPVFFQPMLEIALTDHTVPVFTQMLGAVPLWQGAQGALACQGVPARSRTWGELKSAYR